MRHHVTGSSSVKAAIFLLNCSVTRESCNQGNAYDSSYLWIVVHSVDRHGTTSVAQTTLFPMVTSTTKKSGNTRSMEMRS